MKKISRKIVLVMFLAFVFSSCQTDKLTENKVKEIIQECMDKDSLSNIVETEISLGQGTLLSTLVKSSDIEENYAQLSDEGVINFEKTGKKVLGSPTYNISLTDKGEKYITKIGKNKTWVRCLSLELSEIVEIHENPSTNTADVRIILKKTNRTPFDILLSKEMRSDEPEKMTIRFRKTNEGWKLCD